MVNATGAYTYTLIACLRMLIRIVVYTGELVMDHGIYESGFRM